MSQPPDPNNLEARLADLAGAMLASSHRPPEEDNAALARLFGETEDTTPEE